MFKEHLRMMPDQLVGGREQQSQLRFGIVVFDFFYLHFYANVELVNFIL